MAMTGFDIAVLLILAIGAISGFLRGLVQEMLSLAAWFLSVFAIRFLHAPVAAFLEPHIGTPSGASVLAFALLLLVPYACFKLIAGWAGEMSRASVLGPIDRVLGFGFGAMKGMIIVVLGFSVLALGYDTVWGPNGRPNWITQARTYPLVDAASEQLLTVLAERRREMHRADKVSRATNNHTAH